MPRFVKGLADKPTEANPGCAMAHIGHYLAQNVSKLQDKVLTVCLERARSTKEVYSEVAALSEALRGPLRLSAGDRVGLIARATDDFFQAFLAITACGAVAVPVNLRWSTQETEAALRGIAPSLVFVDADLLHKYGLVLASRSVITLSGEAGIGGHADSAGHMHATASRPARVRQAQELIRDHMGAPLHLQTPGDGAALICFTSGTSGPPKGVVISHTALHCQAMAKLHTVGYREDDVYLHCAPLFHIGGLSSMIAMLAVGATQVFKPVFNAAGALSLIRQHGVTSLIAVPAMIVSLIEASQSNQPERSGNSTANHSGSCTPANSGLAQKNSCPISMRRSLSRMAACFSMRVILLGGGELHGRLRGPLQVLFPNAQITEAYGMTEACSSMTFRSQDMPPCRAALSDSPQHSSAATRAGQITDRKQSELADQRAGSLTSASAGASRHGDNFGAGAIPVGWPPPGIEMGVAPANEATNGACREPSINDTEVGEIVTRGPHVMLGYWGDPGASAGARLPGGWLRTGDVGRVDCTGCLWLRGRIKDTVRSGGENVNAAAVERVLLQVPGVAAAAVVGLPHTRLGEQVTALLSLEKGVEWSGDVSDASASKQREGAEGEARLSAVAVQNECREMGLSPFMVPRVVLAQHTPLPTNASGKVLKHVVRESMLRQIQSKAPHSRL